jgi:hypothetical protein
MSNLARRADGVWQNLNAADLKRMASVWGASNKLPKGDCIAFLRAAIADPHQVDAAIARMLPHERMALALIKLAGGASELRALELAALATGIEPPEARGGANYYRQSLGNRLLDRGIVMVEAGYYYSFYGSDTSGVPVFVDDRVMERLPTIELKPLPFETAGPPPASAFRRAQSVVLDVISIVRTIEGIGGIGLTMAGPPKVTEVRKFARKMGWGSQIEFDGLAFPEPAQALMHAMTKGGLLYAKSDKLMASAPLEQIGSWPVTRILGALICGIVRSTEWTEMETAPSKYRASEYSARARLAVLAILRCLPDSSAWYRFETIEQRLFDSIGGKHSVGALPYMPFMSGNKNEAQASAEESRRQKIQTSWKTNDVPWLQAAFKTWLYALGIVELHLENGLADRFRLTEAGRSILYDRPMEERAAPVADSAAWVVQPNFDVVLFLNDASTEQIAFLEQHAERVQAAQHTAQYRLTRDSVYQGLQRGTGVDRLIEGLSAGSRAELPTNVVSEIRTWSALRERIKIRQCEVLEFATAEAQQDAIARGLKGQPTGKRFVLLTAPLSDSRVSGAPPQIINYADKRPVKCLRISDDGVITLDTKSNDLVTEGLLELWAERAEDRTWRLTRASVAKARKAGRTVGELLTFLGDRTRQAIPELLLVALKAWADKPVKVEFAEVLVLRCAHPDVLEAFLTSKALKSHLAGMIGDDVIVVNADGAESVKAILDWAGVHISTEIKPMPVPEYYRIENDIAYRRS